MAKATKQHLIRRVAAYAKAYAELEKEAEALVTSFGARGMTSMATANGDVYLDGGRLRVIAPSE
ncbi:MAG TPA: hypothetical protein PLF11_00225 [Bacillota bacterium]|nr:hypothetical protein [Dermatophilaceae bacterium]HOI35784.1 hypothetical protein [Bacillota bacterium]